MTVIDMRDWRDAGGSPQPQRALPSNIEAEQALLGAVLLYPAAFGNVAGLLKAEHFFEEIHQRIWTCIVTMAGEGRVANPITLKTFLGDHDLGGFTVPQYLARLAADATTVVNAPDYARMVVDLHARRAIILAAQEVLEQAFDAPVNCPVPDLIEGGIDAFRAVSEAMPQAEQRETVDAAFATLLRRAQDRLDGRTPRVAVTGLTDLDNRLSGGLLPGRLIVLAGRPGMGKAQPLTSPVLTRDGWVAMGDVAEGAWVVRPGGGVVRVASVHPQGSLPIYRVRFHDGRQTLCCADHIWRVWHRQWNAWRDVPLRQLLTYRDVTRFSVPLAAAEYGGGDLPLHPYMLGVLLGDGFFHPGGVLFSTADAEIVEALHLLCPAGHDVERRGAYDYAITTGQRGNRRNLVLDAIRALGLGGARSDTKFVPAPYLRSSPTDRLAVLQGLLDTDGTVEPSKTIRYSSTSPHLADAVAYLARSLGAWAKVRRRAQPRYTYKGEVREGKSCWVVTIRHRDPCTLFRLERHKTRLGDGGQYSESLRLSIASIEPVGEAECQCIRLADDDGLYFTDDFTVTHNTVLATALQRRAAKRGAGVASSNLEIDIQESAARLAASHLASSSRPIDYRDILAGRLDEDQMDRLAAARAELRALPLEIDERSGLSMAQIETRAMQAGKRFERVGKRLDVVVIDYLQLVKVTDRYKGKTVEELGEVALAAKNMAKRHGICVVLLSQLNRGVEHRDSKRPALLDLRGSGNIEEHADAVGLLYRPAYYDREDPKVLDGDDEAVARAARRSHDLEVIWAKNRLGPTGTDTLWCDVGRSQVDSGSRHSGDGR